MDPQFEQWQQAFKASTPDIDVDALINKTHRAQRRLRWKAWADLAGALAVTLFVIYALLFRAESTAQMIVIACLLPVPLGFTTWTFRMRRQQWLMKTTDVRSMLDFEKQALQKQVRYWEISFKACALMWLMLFALAVFNIALYQEWSLWLTQLGANAPVVLATGWRYRYLKNALPARLERINSML